jgi:hypothetical protein
MLGVAMVLDALTPSDRVNLLELYARSVMLIELGRCGEWADLFVPLGSIVCEAQNGPTGRSFKGRDQLVELGRQMIAGDFDLTVGPLTPPICCRRVLSDISLFAHGTSVALGFAHLTVTSISGGEPPTWIASGLFRDLLNKSASGCWRFENRTYVPEGAATRLFTGSPPPALSAVAITR